MQCTKNPKKQIKPSNVDTLRFASVERIGGPSALLVLFSEGAYRSGKQALPAIPAL